MSIIHSLVSSCIDNQMGTPKIAFMSRCKEVLGLGHFFMCCFTAKKFLVYLISKLYFTIFHTDFLVGGLRFQNIGLCKFCNLSTA